LGALGEEEGQQRRGGDDLFEVVEDEENLFGAKLGGQSIVERFVAWRVHAQVLGDRGGHEPGFAHGGERDERDPVGEVATDLFGDAQRQPRFADAPGAGKGEQAHVVPPQQRHHLGNLALPPDQRRERKRQTGRAPAYRCIGHVSIRIVRIDSRFCP
jgi:hypothetical protein